MEAIQRISATTTIIKMIPTTIPALKMPAITEQLLKQDIGIRSIERKYIFFIWLRLQFVLIITETAD